MFLKNFDYISPSITLYFEGQRRHSSIASGIITIITCFLIITVSLYFLSEVVYRKNINAYYYPKYLDDTASYEIGTEGVFHFITFKNGEKFNTSQIRIIGMMSSAQDFLESDLVEGDIEQLPFEYWEYGPCDEYSIYVNFTETKDNNNYFNKLISSSFCITTYFNHDNGKKYKIDQEGFSYPFINYRGKIQESLKYSFFIIKEKQKLPSIISNRYLEKISPYTIHFSDAYIDVEDYEEPIHKFFCNITSQLYDSFFTTNILNFSPLILKTHSGYMIDSIKKISSFLFSSRQKINYLNSGSALRVVGAFEFNMQNDGQIYERSYQKIQDALSRIGGISKIITALGFLINQVYHDCTVVNDLNGMFMEKSCNKKKLNKKVSSLSLVQFKPTMGTRNDKSSTCTKSKKLKKVTVLEVIFHRWNLKYSRVINWVTEYRTRVISEEKLFKLYLVVKFLGKQQNMKPLPRSPELSSIKISDSKNFMNISNTNLEFDNGVLILK